MLNPLAPQRKPGMTDDEARIAAILPPLGHRTPPASWRAGFTFPLRLAKVTKRLAGRLHEVEAFALGSPEMRREMLAVLADLGIELRIYGEQHLQPGGQVLMWNQTSHLDHPALAAAIPVPFRSTFNLEVGKVPKYGAWLRAHGHYFLNRFDEAQWRASLAEAAAWVRAGGTVTVSPEGTRSWDGKLLPMKRGAFILAMQSGMPIVPIAVYGAREALPRGRAVIEPGVIEVEFRPPIATTGYTDETRKGLKAVVAAAFEQALAEGPPSGRETRDPSTGPGGTAGRG